MAEQQGVFRTTISVPGDLKARMDKVTEPVNWSAVACRAFEDKLAEIAAKKENKVMSDVVERLRASLRDEQGESFKYGYEIGKKWAENTATAVQLKRLESFLKTTKTRSQREWERWFWSQDAWKALVGVIEDDKSFRARAAIAFWDVVGETSRRTNDGDFLRGFVEGAVHLWTKVEEQL